MDLIFKDEIRELMQKRDDYCVSIFLPTHRAGREIEQDPIRLDNLLRRAEKELINQGMRSINAKELLGPAYGLVQNGFFTRHQADGLSIFASTDLFRFYRVPIHFQELLAVGNRFHLKPLIPMLNAGNRFYILAISRKSVRLFQATEFGVIEIELKGVPKSMSEALGYDETESRLLFRSMAQASTMKDMPMLHGHGGGVEKDKEYLYNYFKKLKDALHPYLKEEKAPLIFAGVEYLFPIFKDSGIYQNVIVEPLEGNPDGLEAKELHARALRLVRLYFQGAQDGAVQRYLDLTGNNLSSDKLDEILPGAFAGRVDTLLVDTGIQKWGKFDLPSGAIEEHESPARGDEDLLDLAAAQTFLNGGMVFALNAGKMPGATEVSAIFRY